MAKLVMVGGFTAGVKQGIVDCRTMARNDFQSIDGFALRRRDNNPGRRFGLDDLKVPDRFLEQPKQADTVAEAAVSNPVIDPNISPKPTITTDIPAADVGGEKKLPDIDLEPAPPKKARRHFRVNKSWAKRLLLLMGVILLVAGGYFAIKIFLAGGRVFEGNVFNALLASGKELKTDQYGRVNILLFGTSEDDPDHEGADLTDSIMVVSIHPKNKEGFMVSVPRDLWVKYGRACSSGYEGKINVVYQCGKEDASEKEGAELLKSTVSEHFGVEIQYYALLNYTALREAVDAVGGITVEIKSDDPRGILDRNFDWKCNFKCHYVKWPNGPANLDGEHALALARARNAAGGYGLGGGNFDREQYQQKIIVALRNKAMSAGVLSNPVKVTNLIDSLGNNVRTNFDAAEVKTLVKLAQEVDAAKITSLNLIDEEKPLMTTGPHNGQSIVRPVEGVYDFSAIKSFVKAHLSGDAASLESATVDVMNGSGVPGAAQRKADQLEQLGFTIGDVDNAPAGDYGRVVLYDLSAGKKPGTRSKLEQQLGVKALTTLPAGVSSQADFVIIVGTDGAN